MDRLRNILGYNVYYVQPSFSMIAEKVLDMDAAELYATQPNLRAVVGFLSDNVAQLPLKVYRREGETDRVRVRDSTAALLFARPNPDMTRYELMRSLMSDLMLYDRAAWWVLRDADSPSGWQIRPIPPTWITGYSGHDPFAPRELRIQAPHSAPVEVPADSVLIFHGYRPGDPMRGCSPVEALKQTLSEQIEAGRYRNQVWRRGGRMAAYISRPKDVMPWNPEQAAQFKEDFKAAWSGDHGSEAGGIPVLEDGMEIRNTEFNAKEAQWAESVQLSREEVAGVYHLNPSILWPGAGQTYASVKENARALYNDTLGAPVVCIEERINSFLLPMIGADPLEYVELDFSAKLRGSVEEQMQSLASAVGRPFMTANEARAKLNMPAMEDGEGLVIPLNVLVGGQASPYDSAGVEDPYQFDAAPEAKSLEAPRKSRGNPSEEDRNSVQKCLADFFRRQSKSVLPKLGANPDTNGWWDEDRWNEELADDLFTVVFALSQRNAKRALRELRLPDDDYYPALTRNYLRKMCENESVMLNRKTKEDLDKVRFGEVNEDTMKGTYQGVFEFAEKDRSESMGAAFATSVVGWSMLEAVRQCAPDQPVMKTWIVTSPNPRDSHAMLNGETVPKDETFSNGARWPGDTGALDAGEVANCQCQVELTIP